MQLSLIYSLEPRYILLLWMQLSPYICRGMHLFMLKCIFMEVNIWWLKKLMGCELKFLLMTTCFFDLLILWQLYFFLYSLLFSFLLLSLCPISFLLFLFASVGITLMHEVDISYGLWPCLIGLALSPLKKLWKILEVVYLLLN